MNRYGSATQENGKITRILSNTWCHQCKMKHQKIVVCDHFWHEDKNVKCNGRYCPNCCKRHYGEEISDLENLESWICYKCTGKCVCAACRRLRNGEVTTTKNIPSQIQKGKRKRNNKAKSYEESEEEEEFGEEEFIPMMFEKNLRSRNKNDSPTNTSSIPIIPTNNNFVHCQNTTVPIKKTPTNLGMNESAKMPIPKKKEIPKIPLEKKVKIHIPEEELEKANSTSNYLFDILLQVTSLESMQDDGAPPKQSGGNNNSNINVDSKQNTSNLGNPINNKNNTSEPHPNSSILLNNLIHKIPPSEIKKTDLQKILKYESIQSNPLLPSSFHTIVQLRQEVSSLTSELNNMRQDFMKLQRLFESYSQTNEGSHECSPIADGENYVSHPVENFVHNI